MTVGQRQSRSRPAARSAPAPAPKPAPAQTRGAHSAAVHPSAPVPAPPAPPAAASQSSQPGMLAQMAATAGSVAVGSTIGHGLSSMLFGSSRSPEAAEPVAQAAPVQYQQQAAPSCEVQAKGI